MQVTLQGAPTGGESKSTAGCTIGGESKSHCRVHPQEGNPSHAAGCTHRWGVSAGAVRRQYGSTTHSSPGMKPTEASFDKLVRKHDLHAQQDGFCHKDEML